MGADGPSLRDLLGRAKDGDLDAQDALLARYRDYLVLLARLSLSRALQPKLDASDVAQDALVRAHRGLGEFRGETEDEFVAWLRRILTRPMANANRQFRRSRRTIGRERPIADLVADSSQALSRLPAAAVTSPSRGAERREAGLRVADVLTELKRDDREVLTLRSLEGRPWSEVAERMGRSEEAVRALWGRAIQRLGAALEERG
jgi:RNA polymerase sigma-70 factor (ECF subfamily)